MHGIPCALGFVASVWQEEEALCVEHLVVFCSLCSFPTLCFLLCIRVMGACLLGGMGADGWVVKFCQPLVQSPSGSWSQPV